MNTDFLMQQMERIAGEMDRTRESPNATVGYDVLSDALVWSDEYPGDIGGRLADFDCIRILCDRA